MLAKTLTILTVDDDMINLKLLNSLLMRNEHVAKVVEAHNGSNAIEILKSRDDIDLILLDMVMPVMGGIEMLQVVRADTNLKQVPIIVLTTDETKKNEALEHGANAFLMKPIKLNELIKKIEEVTFLD